MSFCGSEKQKRLLFWKLIFNPERSWKQARILLTPRMDSVSLFINRITSSANWRCVTCQFQLGTEMPLKIPKELPLDSRQERTSPISKKSWGERGSPWRRPLPGENSLVGEPFTRTEILEETRIASIQLNHILGKFISPLL